MATRPWIPLSFVLCACGAGLTATEKMAAPPPAKTEAQLAGHRCAGQSEACACRALDNDGDQVETTPPGDGLRRYELRVNAAPGVAWVTVDGAQRVYKGTAHAEDCFYLDLAPGDHHVVLRASGERDDGPVGMGLTVAEHNPKGPWWFDVFRFECGMTSACDRTLLDDWKKTIDGDRRKLSDPCGGVKIKGLGWATGRMPDNVHPHDVQITFTMHVYKKPWDLPPGSASCSER